MEKAVITLRRHAFFIFLLLLCLVPCGRGFEAAACEADDEAPVLDDAFTESAEDSLMMVEEGAFPDAADPDGEMIPDPADPDEDMIYEAAEPDEVILEAEESGDEVIPELSEPDLELISETADTDEERTTVLTQGEFAERLYEMRAGDPDELLAGYVSSVFYPGPADPGIAPGQVSGKKRLAKPTTACLNETELLIYTLLKEMITEAANGLRSSTEFAISTGQLGMEKTSWSAGELGISAGASSAEVEQALAANAFPAFDFEKKIMNALRSACPYELYWSDLYWGYKPPSYLIERDADGNILTVELAGLVDFVFRIIVSPEYSYGGLSWSTRLDTGKTASVKLAAENAAELAAECAGLSDYRKLLSFCTAICRNVSYDDEAASAGGNVPYGNPWQLVYVFDGDPDTNVVCEGYSKAFQYLCDIADFETGVACCTVTGYLNNGTSTGAGAPHMWNILSMEDGKNYIADITGSDIGDDADTGRLFLKGSLGGNAADGYVFASAVEGLRLTYRYDEDAEMTFTPADLALSDSDYELPHTEGCPAGGNMVWHEPVEAGCDTEGSRAYWSCSGCSRLFFDAGGHDEILEESDLTEPVLGHQIEFVEEKEADESADGYIAHYECSRCHRFFRDAEGLTELSREETVIRYVPPEAPGPSDGGGQGTEDPAADGGQGAADTGQGTEGQAMAESSGGSSAVQEAQAAFRLNVRDGEKNIPIRLNRKNRGIMAVSLAPGDRLKSAEAGNPQAVLACVSGRHIVLKGLREKARTKITVTTLLGAKTSFYVRVRRGKIKTASLSVSARSITLHRGESAETGALTAPVTSSQKIKYTSSDTKTAGVRNGLITARNPGTAYITVRSGTKKKIIKVKVTE